jgi:IS605 OrfB family transposase
MQRAISLKLPLTQELIETIYTFNKVCNIQLSEIVNMQIKDNYSKAKLHQTCYKKIRRDYPEFPSALVQNSRDIACEMFKNKDICTLRKIRKNPSSAIRFDLRTCKAFLHSGTIQLTTTQGRKKYQFDLPECFDKYKDWIVKGCTLGYNKTSIILKIIVDNDVEDNQMDEPRLLGIDIGLKNLLALSDGTLIKGKELIAKKRNYAYLRKQLQSKGTPSAIRKLKKIAGRERRYTQQYIHSLSKTLVNMNYDGFVFEDLNIKTNKKAYGKHGRNFNRRISNWCRSLLYQYSTYKAEELSKFTLTVNPYKTSQRDSSCGHIAKGNRNKGWFKCLKCNHQENADTNASKNILQLGYLLKQGSVNNPNVTSLVAIESYKPLNLLGGS